MSNRIVSLTVCAFRRINILYNAPALDLDGSTNSSLSQEQDATASVLTTVGLVFSPLRFDSQASVPASP